MPAFARRDLLLAAPAVVLGGCGSVVGSAIPPVTLPPVSGLVGPDGGPVAGLSPDEYRGRVSVLNVWASWCPYCQAEHEHLMRLSRDRRARLVGLVYRDTAAKALAYLRRAGQPYGALALDDGRLSSALAIKGVPTTFVVGRDGRIAARMPGELDEATVRDRLMPAIDAALGAVVRSARSG